MKRNLAIFAAISALLVGVGFLWLTGAPGAKVETVSTDGKKMVAPKPDSVTTDDDDAVSVLVKSTTGQVSRRSGSRWIPLKSGERLGLNDGIRTGEQSSAALNLGGQSNIEVASGSFLEVREISETVQRLGLVSGRVKVDYQKNGKRMLRLENKEGSVVAQVSAGRFSMMDNGALLAVATQTGRVNLSAAGKTVAVRDGEQSVVFKGDAPTAPVRVATSTFLHITKRVCVIRADGRVSLHGRVPVGAVVEAHDHPIEVDHTGRFDGVFDLGRVRPGKELTLTVTDVWGKVQQHQIPCSKTRTPVSIKKVDINWGGSGQ